jgi:hypothetical protein
MGRDEWGGKMGDKAASMQTDALEKMKILGKENELGTCNCHLYRACLGASHGEARCHCAVVTGPTLRGSTNMYELSPS